MRKLTKTDHKHIQNLITAVALYSQGRADHHQIKDAETGLKDHLMSLETSSPVNFQLWLRKPTTILQGLIIGLQVVILLLMVGLY